MRRYSNRQYLRLLATKAVEQEERACAVDYDSISSWGLPSAVMSQQEIADALGLTLGEVRAAEVSALRKLRAAAKQGILEPFEPSNRVDLDFWGEE